LTEAETILGLCQRFGCLPSALEGEDAEILRLIDIVDKGTKKEEAHDG
jgi:hypothetical protein